MLAIWLLRLIFGKKETNPLKKKRNYLIIRPYPSVAHDKQAKIRCKGKNNIKYSYKKQVSVDIQSGMINKVAVTLANVTDAKGLPHILPKSGAVYANKRYCGRSTWQLAALWWGYI